MAKSARISAFVDYEIRSGVIHVHKCSSLFEKLLTNVKNEYKTFHANREPKINNLEIETSDAANEAALKTGYLKNVKFIDAFSQLKDRQELPFSVTQDVRDQSNSNFFTNFVFPSQHLLKRSYFINSTFSRETFHQIQRHHKIWWMKYGTNPGKYSISDQKSEGFCKFVNIRSNVDGIEMDIERLSFFTLKDCIKDRETLDKYLCRMPNRKKESLPDVIESVVDLQVASLALLMDAVNLSDDYIAFHRRSAPYQLALIVQEPTKELIDLARYIEMLIKETHSSIAILHEAKNDTNSQHDIKSQLQKYDDIGIPYSIILDKTALDQGLFKLRNRNTTLSETIHLSDVTGYLIKIFNSG